MTTRRLAAAFLLCGLVLLALGLADWAAGLDPLLHRLLRLDPAGALRQPVILLSALGDFVAMASLTLLASAVLTTRRRWRDALWLFGTIALGRLVVEIVKQAVRRPRPPLADRLEHVGSWSFPSAHSAGALTTCLAVALVAGGDAPALAAALAFAATIGWTRLALAVHWPSDVLAGWGIGMVWVAAALRVRS